MNEDTVRADDALISTDVDRLIKILSEKKKVSLGELHRLSGIKSRSALETWVRVLEDEGYVRVEYALTGTYLHWADAGVQRKESERTEPAPTSIPDEKGEESVSTDAAEPVGGLSVQHESESHKDSLDEGRQLESQPTPEELLDRYVRIKHDYSYNGKGEGTSVKDNIVRNLVEDNESFEEHRLKRLAYSSEPDATADRIVGGSGSAELEPASLTAEENIEPAALLQGESTETDEKESVPIPRSVYDANVRDLLSAYMEEIKEEKAKLGQLKKKKEMFYTDELVALEKRAEAELIPLMDRLLEHESRLLEVKERVLELPDRVEEAIKLHDELKKLRIEGKTALQQTKQKVEAFARDIKASEKEVRGKIAGLRADIEENEKKVDALERLRESIDARTDKILASLDSLRASIADINERMTALEQSLSETNETRAVVNNNIKVIREDIEKKREDLSALTGELENLTKISSWAVEYLNDYDAKILEIEEYIKKSDLDILKLKEAAEAKCIQKYLNELEVTSDKYDQSLENAIKTEKEIEFQINETKERIAALIKESQKLVRKVGGEAEKFPDYESVKKKIEERAASIKKTITEKTKEKGSLAEEIKKKKKSKD